MCPTQFTKNEPNNKIILLAFFQLYVIIMSCTRFRVNLNLYSCLNVKELLARNWRDIWAFVDSNEIRTHNQLVHKPAFNHLAKLATKWLSVRLQTKWL